MPKKKFAEELKEMKACDKSIEEAGEKDAKTAWADSKRGDFLALYAIKKRLVNKDQMRQIAAEAITHVLPVYEERFPNNQSLRDAVSKISDAGKGKVSALELKKSRLAVQRTRTKGSRTTRIMQAVLLASNEKMVAKATVKALQKCYGIFPPNSPERAAERAWQADMVRRYVPSPE